jgi:hypothetical protein
MKSSAYDDKSYEKPDSDGYLESHSSGGMILDLSNGDVYKAPDFHPEQAEEYNSPAADSTNLGEIEEYLPASDGGSALALEGHRLETDDEVAAALRQPMIELTSSMLKLGEMPDSPSARTDRDRAAFEVFSVLSRANSLAASPDQVEALSTLMRAYAAGGGTPEVKESLASLALIFAVSVLAATGAGVLGAVAVSDVVWKEAVKATIGGAVSAVAALVTERLMGRSSDDPPDR